MIARVRQPPAPLAAHVEFLWYHEGLDSPLHRLLPDGAIELMFDLNDVPRAWLDADLRNPRAVSRGWISGQHTRPIGVQGASAACMIGVRFRPGGAFPFVGVPLAELTDRVVEMDLVWGAFARELREQLLEAGDGDARFAVLERALLRRAAGALVIDPLLAGTLRCLERCPDTVTIRQVASRAGVSQKRLIAMFDRHVGLKPKMFSRVMRLQRILQHIERTPSTPWSLLAAQYGYCDQAHLVNDFSALTCMRPTEYLRDKGEELNWVPVR